MKDSILIFSYHIFYLKQETWLHETNCEQQLKTCVVCWNNKLEGRRLMHVCSCGSVCYKINRGQVKMCILCFNEFSKRWSLESSNRDRFRCWMQYGNKMLDRRNSLKTSISRKFCNGISTIFLLIWLTLCFIKMNLYLILFSNVCLWQMFLFEWEIQL